MSPLRKVIFLPFTSINTLCVIAGLTRNLLKIMGLRVKPAMTVLVF